VGPSGPGAPEYPCLAEVARRSRDCGLGAPHRTQIDPIPGREASPGVAAPSRCEAGRAFGIGVRTPPAVESSGGRTALVPRRTPRFRFQTEGAGEVAWGGECRPSTAQGSRECSGQFQNLPSPRDSIGPLDVLNGRSEARARTFQRIVENQDPSMASAGRRSRRAVSAVTPVTEVTGPPGFELTCSWIKGPVASAPSRVECDGLVPTRLLLRTPDSVGRRQGAACAIHPLRERW
jgi:hypothetical protein